MVDKGYHLVSCLLSIFDQHHSVHAGLTKALVFSDTAELCIFHASLA
jgi:hypothetical protein